MATDNKLVTTETKDAYLVTLYRQADRPEVQHYLTTMNDLQSLKDLIARCRQKRDDIAVQQQQHLLHKNFFKLVGDKQLTIEKDTTALQRIERLRLQVELCEASLTQVSTINLNTYDESTMAASDLAKLEQQKKDLFAKAEQARKQMAQAGEAAITAQVEEAALKAKDAKLLELIQALEKEVPKVQKKLDLLEDLLLERHEELHLPLPSE